MTTAVSFPQQQQQLPQKGDVPINSSTGDDKTTAHTAPTVVESSEEFTLSSELTTASAEETTLRLSNMEIVEENSQQQLQQSEDDNDDSGGKVRFASDVYIITEEDTYVEPRKVRKSKKSSDNDEQQSDNEEVPESDIWWTIEELEKIELNAMYMVKESQQYQEEVICTVLYNKAFLSAANLAKRISSEEEMSEELQDVAAYSNTLESWTAVGHSRRGLENMVSDKAVLHAIDSRQALLDLQQDLGDACTCEALALKYQEKSRTARIMARMLGQADADSLKKAEKLCEENPSLPEPPGRYSGDHLASSSHRSERVSRRSRRGSLISGVKKAVGNVFRRQSSVEVNQRRIRKMQKRQQEQEQKEQEKTPSEEFRRSFLEKLDYGEQ